MHVAEWRRGGQFWPLLHRREDAASMLGSEARLRGGPHAADSQCDGAGQVGLPGASCHDPGLLKQILHVAVLHDMGRHHALICIYMNVLVLLVEGRSAPILHCCWRLLEDASQWCTVQGQGGRGAAHGRRCSQTNGAAQLQKGVQACREGAGPYQGESFSTSTGPWQYTQVNLMPC